MSEMANRECAIEEIEIELEKYKEDIISDLNIYLNISAKALLTALKALKTVQMTPDWIPLTKRPMTEDEREFYKNTLEYVDDMEIFNCPLPDDGEEVLITSYGGVEVDTFINDSVDGCYFENRDIDDVRAWMRLPQPYKGDDK